MRVPLTAEMLAALREVPEIPDNLLRVVNEAKAEGPGFAVTLSGDEAMAMEEMCEWYVLPDPESGELTAKGKVFDAIVKAIHRAEDA